MTEFEDQFINRLEKTRKKKRVSPLKLSRTVGLDSVQIIKDIESGKKSATLEQVEKIAEAMELAPKELLGVCSRSANERVQAKAREVEERLYNCNSALEAREEELRMEKQKTAALKKEIKENQSRFKKEIKLLESELKVGIKQAKADFNKKVRKTKADLKEELDTCARLLQHMAINRDIIEDSITLIAGERIEGGLRLLKSIQFDPNKED